MRELRVSKSHCEILVPIARLGKREAMNALKVEILGGAPQGM